MRSLRICLTQLLHGCLYDLGQGVVCSRLLENRSHYFFYCLCRRCRPSHRGPRTRSSNHVHHNASPHPSVASRAYLGAGTIGAEPAAGFFGIGTVTSRCSPLPFMTLKETLPDSDPAAMLLATACAVSTALPPASTMTSPATIPFSCAGLPAVTAVMSAPFVASGRLFCLRSCAVNVRSFKPIRGESCASTAPANTSTATARTLAIACKIKVLDFTLRSRITTLHCRTRPRHLLD